MNLRFLPYGLALLAFIPASSAVAAELEIYVASVANDSEGFHPNLITNPESESPADSRKACDFLNAKLDPVRDWMKWYGEEPGARAVCVSSRGQEHLSLVGSMPKFAIKMDGRTANAWGPNCYNTSLYLNRIQDTIRYVTEKEISFWLSSRLCNVVKSPGRRTEKSFPLIGAIYARSKGADPIHTTHLMTEDLVFDKAGRGQDSQYGYAHPRSVFDPWEVPASCRGWNNVADEGRCSLWVRYYQCEKLKDYLREHPFKENPGLRETLSAFKTIEKEFDKFLGAESPQPVDKVYWKKAAEKLQEIKTKAVVERDEFPGKSTEYLLWSGLYEGATSSLVQVKYITGETL